MRLHSNARRGLNLRDQHEVWNPDSLPGNLSLANLTADHPCFPANPLVAESLYLARYSDTSRPFEKPKSGRIAVKVINHSGDEVMKVFRL